MQRLVSRIRTRKGFTLVELAVVIVIIGVLAAFGVPRFLQSVEKSKATEAFNYLSAIQSAEERYLAQNGTYATDPTVLDIQYPALKYFSQPTAITAVEVSTGSPTWSYALTRLTPSPYGAYTVIFTENGFDTGSTIATGTNAEINPVDVSGS